MNPIVFLVDDDAAVRDALRGLLEVEGFAVEAYDSATAFLQRYRPEQPGCLILDVRMPGMSGAELQAELGARRIRMPIIFLTGHGTIPLSVRAVKAGAVDFLEKPVNLDTLLARIREAIAVDTRERAVGAVQAQARSKLARLSAREREIAVHVLGGRSSKEIARALGISSRTVEVHRGRMMLNLGALSVLELAAIVQASGLDLSSPDPGVSETVS